MVELKKMTRQRDINRLAKVRLVLGRLESLAASEGLTKSWLDDGADEIEGPPLGMGLSDDAGLVIDWLGG